MGVGVVAVEELGQVFERGRLGGDAGEDVIGPERDGLGAQACDRFVVGVHRVDAQLVGAEERGQHGAASGRDPEPVHYLGGVVDGQGVGARLAPFAQAEGVDRLQLDVGDLVGAVQADLEVDLGGHEGMLGVAVAPVAGDDLDLAALGLQALNQHLGHGALPADAAGQDGSARAFHARRGLVPPEIQARLPGGQVEDGGDVRAAQQLAAVVGLGGDDGEVGHLLTPVVVAGEGVGGTSARWSLSMRSSSQQSLTVRTSRWMPH